VNSLLTEKELIEGLARNDREAIAKLYKDNYHLIQQMVISNNGTEDDARDIFQEAMIVLYDKARSGSFELNAKIRTYVYSVCRRLWLKRLQYLKRFESSVESLEEVVPVEEDLESHEERTRQYGLMEQAMGRLGEPCKSLLEAYYVDQQSMQDIAERFGYTNADNAKNQKYKCLVRLKKLFFAQYKTGSANG
jgi:RNA polymerase sigma factor (sigma-70 family)